MPISWMALRCQVRTLRQDPLLAGRYGANTRVFDGVPDASGVRPGVVVAQRIVTPASTVSAATGGNRRPMAHRSGPSLRGGLRDPSGHRELPGQGPPTVCPLENHGPHE